MNKFVNLAISSHQTRHNFPETYHPWRCRPNHFIIV